MAELHPYEDQAVLYLLGELSPDQRREFESRLAESAELRALLRELEEGSVALAMSAPRRRAPARIWKRIEGVIAREQKRESITSFWLSWWRYGWAAAAICLVGWLFQAFWPSRSPGSASVNSLQAIHQPSVATNEVRTVAATHQEKAALPAAQRESNQTSMEIIGLRRQVADLSGQITYLSQSVSQQQALLLETNRFKFFQLASASDGAAATNAPISPALQRALFVAMARELGWLPPGSGAGLSPTGGLLVGQRETGLPATTNVAGVDFVDLRSGSNTVTNPQPQPETPPGDSPDLYLATSSGVPGFISGTNAVLAFDSTVAVPGAVLRFWSGGTGGWYAIGSSVLGNNPMVVTVPFSSMGGGNLTVTSGNSLGSSNVLGQFPPPGGP